VNGVCQILIFSDDVNLLDENGEYSVITEKCNRKLENTSQ
jgi:hypothetical protein